MHMKIMKETQKLGSEMELSVYFINMNDKGLLLSAAALLLSITILNASPLPVWSQLGSSSNNEPTIVRRILTLELKSMLGECNFLQVWLSFAPMISWFWKRTPDR